MGIYDKLFGKKQEKEKKYRPKKDWSFHANRANTYLKEGKFTEAITRQPAQKINPYSKSLYKKLR